MCFDGSFEERDVDGAGFCGVAAGKVELLWCVMSSP